MSHKLRIAVALVTAAAGAGCAAQHGPPLTYLATARPEGAIRTENPGAYGRSHDRGGWYFGNHNFRPAPDIGAYLEEAHSGTPDPVMRNVDVILDIPFAIDILFFGYNMGHDHVRVNVLSGEDR